MANYTEEKIIGSDGVEREKLVWSNGLVTYFNADGDYDNPDGPAVTRRDGVSYWLDGEDVTRIVTLQIPPRINRLREIHRQRVEATPNA